MLFSKSLTTTITTVAATTIIIITNSIFMKNNHLAPAIEKGDDLICKTWKIWQVIMTAETKSQNTSEVILISDI